jgi:hypothetical protein
MSRKGLICILAVSFVLFSAQAALSAPAPVPSVKGTYDVTGPLNVTLDLSQTVGGKKKPVIKVSLAFGDVAFIGETFTFTDTIPPALDTGDFYDGTGLLTGAWTQKVVKGSLTKDFTIDLDLESIIDTLASAGITATVTSKSFKGTVAMKKGIKTIAGTYSYTAILEGSGGLNGTLKVSGKGTGTPSDSVTAQKYGPVEPDSPAALRNLWITLKESLRNYKATKIRNR